MKDGSILSMRTERSKASRSLALVALIPEVNQIVIHTVPLHSSKRAAPLKLTNYN